MRLATGGNWFGGDRQCSLDRLSGLLYFPADIGLLTALRWWLQSVLLLVNLAVRSRPKEAGLRLSLRFTVKAKSRRREHHRGVATLN
jgi:hypothetical protein